MKFRLRHVYAIIFMIAQRCYCRRMAIYFLNYSIVQRSKSQSAVAAAAYRHGRKMTADLGGKSFDYSEKTDVTHSEITLPEDAPAWLREAYGAPALGRLLDGKEATEANRRTAVGQLSERLWNDVELFEGRHNRHAMRARLARKINFALPVELGRDQQIDLARRFVENSLAARGAVVDWVMHEPEPNDEGEANPHIHVMITLRHAGERGWGLKNRVWEPYSVLRALRAEWAREANIALERAGRPERIDHRKLVDQGIELDPTSYDRTLADALEARGEEFRRKVKAEEALAQNRDYLRADPEHILAVVSAERTVFSESDVVNAFMRQGFEGSAATVLKDRAMQSFEVIGLVDDMGRGERLYVTRAQLHVEANLMVEALEMAGSRVALPDGAGTIALPKDVVDGLDAGQRAALEEMVSDKRLSLVSGHAGTGKTHVIGLATQVWTARGFEVLGGAISGKATQGLAGIEGMQAKSLAAWEARWSRGQLPTHGRFVLFVDEAGMVGTATWDRLQHQVAQMGGILRPVGDPEQLQPVLDTSVFGRLLDRIGGAVITNVRRMRDPGDREATKLFARGLKGAEAALAHYRDKGGIEEAATVGKAVEALALAYYPDEVSAPAGPDPIESGAGVIALPLAALAEKEKDDGQARVGPSGGPRGKGARGPSVAVVREALLERAEDLFRTVFGEPLRPAAKEWQAREKTAQVMRMQGPKRGLWWDYSAGEGGDLLDLVAREFCGLSSARADFPKAMKEAARYCGVATDQPVDETVLRARVAERQRKAWEAEKREAARRAELVKTLAGRAVPVEGTPAVSYLASRGITDLPEDEIAWLPPVPGEAVKSPEFGALVVWARDAGGKITGGQRILLNPDGTKAARDVRKPSFGAIGGSHARFPARGDAMSVPLRGFAENVGQDGVATKVPASPATAPQEPSALRAGAEEVRQDEAGRAQPLVIAEGPESALSIWQSTGLETWAVFGASNWKSVPIPTDRPVILAPDRDAPDSPAGQAFRRAVLHHLARGCDLRIATAPEPEGSKHDLNDTDQRAGPEAVRDAIAAARPVRVSDPGNDVVPSASRDFPLSEPTRVAVGYSGRDVDRMNDALRARAIQTGRVDEDAAVNYGEIIRLDRRGLVPKRYTAPMVLAPGDRVIFTEQYRELDIAKSSFATVTDTRPGEIDLVPDRAPAREVTIDMTEFDHFDYGYAATAHKVQGMTVDHAFGLAHPRMSRPVTHVMMTRHRDSVKMFVPQSRFRDDDFEKVASRDDYLALGWEGDGMRRSPIAGSAFADTDHGVRADALLAGEVPPVSGVSFLRDPHLLAVMRRTAGLLSSDWAGGDPILGADEKGYGAEPQRVIDDLIRHHSTIRAEQVAAELSRAAPHPDTFVRLFREAMSHPGLVALGDVDAPGGARVYSTGAQVELELEALDLGVALGLAHEDKGLGVPDGHVAAALAMAGLDARATAAMDHGAAASQLRLITGGAGSGKTAVLSALGQAHESSGFRVHRIAPNRSGTRTFAEQSKESVRSVGSFVHALEAGSIDLDAQSVILLDEARMLGARDTKDLLEIVSQSGAKLIAAWDPGPTRFTHFQRSHIRVGLT